MIYQKDIASVAECKRIAEQASKENPGQYFTVQQWTFGNGAVMQSKRLHVHAPSDSFVKGYWLNGNFKTFTERQQAADWNATPTLT